MGFSVSGLAGSGKDTFADILCKEESYHKDHFAFDLKNIAKEYFNWNGEKDDKGRVLLQQLGTEVGRSFHSNIWLIKFGARNGLSMPSGECLPSASLSLSERLGLVNFYAHHVDDKSISKARLLALVEFGWDGLHDAKGDELIANIQRVAKDYDEDSWSGAGAAKIDQKLYEKTLLNEASFASKTTNGASSKLIVPDCRFPNEIEFLKHHGFTTIEVNRPGTKKMGHASETSLDNHAFDITIQNAGTLDELREKSTFILEMKTLHLIDKLIKIKGSLKL